MKKPFFIIVMCAGITCGLLLLFLLFAPEERVFAAKESWRRIQKDKAQLCLDVIRKDLNDPDSARIVSFEKSQDNLYYILKYKAKNGYGAYVQGEQGFDEMNGEIVVSVLYDLNKQIEEINERNKNTKPIYPYMK